MAFLDIFTDIQTISAVVTRENGVYNPTLGRVVNSETSVGTCDSIFYLGGQTEGVQASKIRENVDATLIVDPGTDIRERDTVTVNSKKYSVVYFDDIGLQGDAIVCGLGLIA